MRTNLRTEETTWICEEGAASRACTPFVPNEKFAPNLFVENKGLSPHSGGARPSVYDDAPDETPPKPPQTAVSWGLSAPEAKRFTEALHLLERWAQEDDLVLLYLVVAADHLDDAAWMAADRDVNRVVGKVQSRSGMDHPIWLEVREGAGARHANKLIPLPADRVKRVASEWVEDRFGIVREIVRVTSPLDGCLTGNVWLLNRVEQPARFRQHNPRTDETDPRRRGNFLDLQLVTDINKLARYLSKEQSSQASFVTGVLRRAGSHKISIGGDRVRMSVALRDQLVKSGRAPDWTETYAKPGRGLISAKKKRKKAPKAKLVAPQSTINGGNIISIADRFDARTPPPQATHAGEHAGSSERHAA